jgi:hypothetical protein
MDLCRLTNHLNSLQGHKRRFNQFVRHSKDVDPQEDALSVVLDKMQSEQSTFASAPLEGGKSKRALKKVQCLRISFDDLYIESIPGSV